ncbi:MAG: hypothetical protein K2L60_09815 [Bacteroides sp.]|nr:hypothetical protein [Bacteroides sp.]
MLHNMFSVEKEGEGKKDTHNIYTRAPKKEKEGERSNMQHDSFNNMRHDNFNTMPHV